MVKRQLKFSESDLARIKQKVAEVEKTTSGEVVPFVVASSGRYLWVNFFWALAGWVSASLAILVYSHTTPWPLSADRVIVFQALLSAVFFGLSFIPAIKRMTIPPALRQRKAEYGAHAQFLRAGLTRTRERTGVLIFFSLFERRLIILADEGIYKKLPPEYWQGQADKVVEGIHRGHPVDLICEVIGAIGTELAKHFPRRSDDTNELEDDLRTE